MCFYRYFVALWRVLEPNFAGLCIALIDCLKDWYAHMHQSHLVSFVCNSSLDVMDVWLTGSLAALLLMLLLPPISLMDRSSSSEVCGSVDSSNFVNVIGSHLHITEIPRYFPNLLVFIWYITFFGEGRLGLELGCPYCSLLLLYSILFRICFL